MKVRKWIHPNLDQPLYLKPGECAPVEYLPKGSNRGLFQNELVELTRVDFEAQQLGSLFDEEEFDETISDDEIEEKLASETPFQLKTERPLQVSRTRVPKIRPVSLSRRIAQQLLDEGADYGSIFATEELEKALGCTRDMLKFQFAICAIRSIFLREGMYLTSKGQHGEKYVVLEANQNIDVMRVFSRRAIISIDNAVILGENTNCATLSAQEKRRHESKLAKAAHRQILLRHSETVVAQLGESITGLTFLASETEINVQTDSGKLSSLDKSRFEGEGGSLHNVISSSDEDPATILMEKEET